MDQDRRDAAHWAEEWNIKRRNRRIITVLVSVVAVAALVLVSNYISVILSRMTFSSEEEMRAAVQGRFAVGDYEDIEISGDDITLTYYSISHYDKEYAEKYGYEEYGDSIYEDTVVKWNYRTGEIKCRWMDSIKVDRDGNLMYYSQTFIKTDKPRPVPFDPTTLSNYHPMEDAADSGTDANLAESEAYSNDTGLTEEEKVEQEAAQENLEETQDAAESSGEESRITEDE